MISILRNSQPGIVNKLNRRHRIASDCESDVLYLLHPVISLMLFFQTLKGEIEMEKYYIRSSLVSILIFVVL